MPSKKVRCWCRKFRAILWKNTFYYKSTQSILTLILLIVIAVLFLGESAIQNVANFTPEHNSPVDSESTLDHDPSSGSVPTPIAVPKNKSKDAKSRHKWKPLAENTEFQFYMKKSRHFRTKKLEEEPPLKLPKGWQFMIRPARSIKEVKLPKLPPTSKESTFWTPSWTTLSLLDNPEEVQMIKTPKLVDRPGVEQFPNLNKNYGPIKRSPQMHQESVWNTSWTTPSLLDNPKRVQSIKTRKLLDNPRLELYSNLNKNPGTIKGRSEMLSGKYQLLWENSDDLRRLNTSLKGVKTLKRTGKSVFRRSSKPSLLDLKEKTVSKVPSNMESRKLVDEISIPMKRLNRSFPGKSWRPNSEKSIKLDHLGQKADEVPGKSESRLWVEKISIPIQRSNKSSSGKSRRPGIFPLKQKRATKVPEKSDSRLWVEEISMPIRRSSKSSSGKSRRPGLVSLEQKWTTKVPGKLESRLLVEEISKPIRRSNKSSSGKSRRPGLVPLEQKRVTKVPGKLKSRHLVKQISIPKRRWTKSSSGRSRRPIFEKSVRLDSLGQKRATEVPGKLETRLLKKVPVPMNRSNEDLRKKKKVLKEPEKLQSIPLEGEIPKKGPVFEILQKPFFGYTSGNIKRLLFRSTKFRSRKYAKSNLGPYYRWYNRLFDGSTKTHSRRLFDSPTKASLGRPLAVGLRFGWSSRPFIASTSGIRYFGRSKSPSFWRFRRLFNYTASTKRTRRPKRTRPTLPSSDFKDFPKLTLISKNLDKIRIFYTPNINPVVEELMDDFKKSCVASPEEEVSGHPTEENLTISFQKWLKNVPFTTQKIVQKMPIVVRFDKNFETKCDNLSYSLTLGENALYGPEYSKILQCQIPKRTLFEKMFISEKELGAQVDLKNYYTLDYQGVPFEKLSLKLCLDKLFLERRKIFMPVDLIDQKILPLPSFKKEGCKKVAYHLDTLLLVESVILIFMVQILTEEKRNGTENIIKLTGVRFWLRYLRNSILIEKGLLKFYERTHTFGVISENLKLGPIGPLHWSAWAIFLLPFYFLVFILTLAFPYIDKSTYASPGVYVIYIFLFCACAEAYLLLLYTICDAGYKAVNAIFLWMAPYFIVLYWIDFNSNMTHFEKFIMVLVYIFPTGTMNQAMRILKQCDIYGRGVSFSNASEPIVQWLGYPAFSTYLIHLFCLTVFYVLLAWLLDFLQNNEKVQEFFSCEICRKKGKGKKYVKHIEPDINQPYEGSNTEPVEGKQVLRIRSLVKNISGRNIVNGLNLDVVENMINVLIGHSGTGKTTTLNIIMKKMLKTSGKIRADPPLFSGKWSYCPYQPIIFKQMSVRNHLIFFGILRGLSSSAAEDRAHTTLEMFNLTESMNHSGHKISVVQQKLTNIAMSMVGTNAKILVLDEPTKGFDLKNKGLVWNILLGLRSSYTLFLTTNSMEEAEILADRIIMINSGKLFCSGTTPFLQQLFGVGYVLSVEGKTALDSKVLLSLIHQYSPEARLDHTTSNQAFFLMEDIPNNTLNDLQKTLEANKQNLDIKNFEFSPKSLQEVYIRIGMSVRDMFITDQETYVPDEIVDKRSTLLGLQCAGLLLKRPMIVCGSLTSALCFVFVYITIFLIAIFGYGQRLESPKSINLSRFKKAHIYIGVDRSEDMRLLGKNLVDVINKDAQATIVERGTLRPTLAKWAQNNTDEYLARAVLAIDLSSGFGRPVMTIYVNPLTKYSSFLAAEILIQTLGAGIIKTTYGPTYAGQLSYLANNIRILSPILIFKAVVMLYLLSLQFQENRNNFKKIQILSGVPRLLYWATTAFWDVIFAWIAIIVILIVFSMYSLEPIPSPGYLFIMITLFVLATLPLVYLCSYKDNVVLGTMLLRCTIIFCLLISFICSIGQLLSVYSKINPDETFASKFKSYSYLKEVFPLFIPTVNLMYFLDMAPYTKIFGRVAKESVEKGYPAERTVAYYLSYNALCARTVMNFIFCIVLYWSIFLFIDFGYGMFCCVKIWKDRGVTSGFDKRLLGRSMQEPQALEGQTSRLLAEDTDNDVLKEYEDVKYMCESGKRKKLRPSIISSEIQYEVSSQRERIPALAVFNIDQVYRFGDFFYQGLYGVKNITLAVQKGICFGILGCNGAGKTTLFKVIVADHLEKNGEVYVSGLRKRHILCNHFNLMNIGFCTQKNTVHPNLSGKNILSLFCLFKGVPWRNISDTRNKWFAILDFKKYRQLSSTTYSYGDSRKLTLSLALMGSPKVLLLDEPTEGIDPVGKVRIYQLIESAKEQGITIVLSSHFVEEIEDLCDRLTILDQGKIQGIGDTHKIVEKWSTVRYAKWSQRFLAIYWKNLFYYQNTHAILTFLFQIIIMLLLLGIAKLGKYQKLMFVSITDSKETLSTEDQLRDGPAVVDYKPEPFCLDLNFTDEKTRWRRQDDYDYDYDHEYDLDTPYTPYRPTTTPTTSYSPPIPPSTDDPEMRGEKIGPPVILYFPKTNKLIKELMTVYQNKCVEEDVRVYGFDSESALMAKYKTFTLSKLEKAFAPKEMHEPLVIRFDADSFKSWKNPLSYSISYTLNSRYGPLYTTFLRCKYPKITLFDIFRLNFVGADDHSSSVPFDGVIIQKYASKFCLDKIYMEKRDGKKIEPYIDRVVQNVIPLPSFKKEGCFDATYYMASLLLIETFLLIFLVSLLLEEKKSGIEVIIIQMGASFWIRYLTWALFLAPFFFLLVLVVLLFMAIDAYSFVNMGLLFIYLCLFTACAEAYVLIIYVTSSKTRHIFMAILFWFLPPVVIWVAADYNLNMSGFETFLMILVYLFPTGTMIHANRIMKQCDVYGTGLNFGNANQYYIQWLGYPAYSTYLIHLFFLTVAYVLFAWLLDFLQTNEKAREFLRCKFCMRNKDEEEVFHDFGEGFDAPEKGKNFEPTSGKLVIQTKYLIKKYSGRKVVNNLNMDVFGNMITILLGHNGAGKTTTISMLLGLISKSSGKIKTNPPLSAGDWGYCPQHTMVIPNFSIKNHLILFALLRGLSCSEAKRAAVETLDLVKLTHVQNHTGKKVSGGQQRMANIAMAMIGDTKILVLDEPTAGLDAENKTRMWDTLLELRATHTIFMTTHSMEEAEILADRIIIMHAGKVICSGTTSFLKQLYGVGYVVSVLGEHGYDPEGLVFRFIKQFAPGARIDRIFSQSAVYVLEYLPNSIIIQLLQALQTYKDKLRLKSHTISFMNLEEVFIKSGEAEGDASVGQTIYEPDPVIANKCGVCCFQIVGLLIKRPVLVFGSCWSATLFILTYGIVFLIFLLINNNPLASVKTVSLEEYKKSHIFIGHDGDESRKNLANKMAAVVLKHSSNATVVSSATLRPEMAKWASDSTDEYLAKTVVAIKLDADENVTLMTVYSNPLCLPSSILAAEIFTEAIAGDNINTKYGPSSTSGNILGGLFTLLGPLVILQGIVFIYLLNLQLNETILNFKAMQIMSGVPRIVYWLMTVFWDIIFSWFALALMFLALAIFGVESTIPNGDVFAQSTLFVLSMLPFVYILSYRNAIACGIMTFWFTLIGSIILSFICTLCQTAANSVQTGSGNNFGWLKYIRHIFCHIYPSINFGYFLLMGSSTSKMKGMSPAMGIKFETYDEVFTRTTINFVIYIILLWILFLLVDSGYGMLCCVKCCGNTGVPVDTKAVNYIALDKQDKPKKKHKKKKNEPVGKKIGEKQREKVLKEGPDPDVLKEDEVVKYMTSRGNKLIPLSRDANIYFDQHEYDVIPDVTLKNIELHYRFGSCCAEGFCGVRDVSLAIAPGICFGLLGVNGAGKTSLFKVIVGQHIQKNGYVYFHGTKRNMCNQSKNQMGVGYCPQEDSLHPHLSGCLLLTLFCFFKGVKCAHIKSTRQKWLKIFSLEKHAKKNVATYSGGMKRKLVNALALMGNPQMLFMDEPTEGVDPVGRRGIWQLIQSAKENGVTIILTSHSMEECDALCDRLTIMVAGRLICIGDNTYLKVKYTKGFTVLIAIETEVSEEWNQDVKKLQEDVEGQYGEAAILIQDQPTFIQYNIDQPDLQMSEVFKFLEAIKARHEIVKDYQVGESSLRQVFLSFAEEMK